MNYSVILKNLFQKPFPAVMNWPTQKNPIIILGQIVYRESMSYEGAYKNNLKSWQFKY